MPPGRSPACDGWRRRILRVTTGNERFPSSALGRTAFRISRYSRTQSVKTSQRNCVQASRCGPSSTFAAAGTSAGSLTPVFLVNCSKAACAKIGVGQCRFVSLPTGVGVMVVEPNAVDLVRRQHAAKLVHAILAIAGMKRTHSLPAVRRRRRLAIRADRRGIGMFLQIRRRVQRVELGKNLQPHLAIPVDLLLLQPA